MPSLRVCILCCALALLACLSPAQAAQIQDYDRPVCYVNDAIITRGDVRERLQSRLYLLRMRDQLPRNAQQMRGLEEEILEELINEELLLDQAERLQVTVDERLVRREVVEEFSRRGYGSDMRNIARAVDERVRQTRIEQVLRFYQESLPGIGPEQLRRVYRERAADFRQPGRVRLRQILLATSDPGRLEVLRRQMFDVVKAVRGHGDAAVAALIDLQLIDRVVEADESGQVAILLSTMRRLLAEPVLREQAPGIHERIDTILSQAGGLRSRSQALALARFLQGQIDAVGPLEWRRELVAHLARLYSDGPAAKRGGDLGLVEPGRLSQAQLAAVAPLPQGGVSGPFWIGQACALVFVDTVVPPAVPSLEQVSAEMEGLLRHEQRQAVRENTLAELRRRARVDFPD